MRWDPMNELARFQQEFDSLFTGPSGMVHQWPAVNVRINENEAYLSTELPGVDPNDLNIAVEGEKVSVSGKRMPQDLGGEGEYHRRERLHGEFNRTVQLPFRVDAQHVEAALNKGVLVVKLPRAEEDKPKKITIKAA